MTACSTSWDSHRRRVTSSSPTSRRWSRHRGPSTWARAHRVTRSSGRWRETTRTTRTWTWSPRRRFDSALTRSAVANPFDLHGRKAVVTGANTGLGQAIAIALAEAGADIVAVGRTDPVETQNAIGELGRRFLSVHADLADTARIPDIIEAALARFGRVDILVNNAGIIRRNAAV